MVDEEEKPEVTVTRIAFEKHVNEMAQEKVEEWKNNGKLIFSKIAIAKDLNEFFLYKKKDPQFLANLKSQEEEFIGYTEKEKPIKKEKKKSL